MMINRLRNKFNKWGWLALMVVFMVVIIYFAETSQRLFEESIVKNFNEQQLVLMAALEAVVEDHINEAEQNLRTISQEIVRMGNLQKSGEILSAVYSVHKDDFLAIDIYASDGKLIERFPEEEGQSKNIPNIQTAIVNYSEEQNQPFLSRRYLYGHQSTVGIILPFTLPDGERYFIVGLLKIEDFLKQHFSTWEHKDICFILANHEGDILSMLNVEHEYVEIMSEGNIRLLDETCLNCHKPDDFADIIRSLETNKPNSSVFHDPNGKVKNRNTTLLPIYNDIWSWSACSPYEMIQGAIDKNFSNIRVYSIVSILVLGLISLIAFRAQKRGGIIEAEAENLRKIAEASSALAKTEDKYRALFEESLDAVYFTTKAGEFINMNKSGLELFGYTREEIKNINVVELYARPEDRKTFAKLMEKQGFVQDYELDLQHKDGTPIRGLFSVLVRKDEAGNIDGYHGIIHDITKRRESEKALRQATELDKKRAIEIEESYKALQESQNAAYNLMEDLTIEIAERREAETAVKESEKKFRTLFEDSRDAIYFSTVDGKIIDVNKAFLDLFDCIREELSELLFQDFYLNPNDRTIFQEKIEKQGYVYDYHMDLKKKNGFVMNCQLTATVRKDPKGNIIGYQGIIRDMTERIQSRKELEQALEKAKQGERVKSLFLANMSHEIRTPLNAILGFTDLLEQSAGHLVGPEERGFFDTIRRSGNRLMKTIHEVLDMSQIEAGIFKIEQKELDLVKLAQSVTNDLKRQAEKKGLTLSFSSNISQSIVIGDDYCISQALMNIIDNAIKYTNEGKIDVQVSEKDDQVVVTIKDTGIGISEEYLDEIFEVFTQESMGYTKKFQGVGLGLALSRRYLEMCNAKIEVLSGIGVGSVFTLIFQEVEKPKLIGVEKPAEEKPLVPVSERKRKPLILVVEDDENSKRLITFFLKKQYETCFAVSVKGAKLVLKTNPVELILLDLSLIGEEDGLDLAKYLRKTKKWKDIPIIATTAHAFEKDRENCLNAGCNDYLAKPIKQTDLLNKIEQWV